jgi:hypothetical protein
MGFLLITQWGFSQFQLKIKSSNSLDSIAYLRATVFDEKNYIPKDTIQLNKTVQTIKQAKPIVGGIYYLYFPKSKQKINLIIDNKDSISIVINDSDYLGSINSNNSKNDSFFSYQKLEKNLSYFDSLYDKEIKQGKKFNLAQKALFFKEKNTVLFETRIRMMKKLKPTSALYIYFDVLNKLDASVPNKKKFSDRITFFNNIDINSPKLLFTPLLKQVITEYLSYYPLQADSIVKGVDTIMLKLDCKSKAYPYVFDQIVKILKNREIQNNTMAYAYFLNKYVKEKKCKFLDPTIEKNLLNELENVNALKFQDTSMNMVLKDTAGVEKNLHEFAKQFDYTLITFFDPTCDHCKVELPKMDSIIHILENQLVLKIGKYSVCNELILQSEVWKSFINTHHLSKNYAHVHLGQNNDLRKSYDAFTNPLFYLINKEGKFVGKKISVNTLKNIIVNHLQSNK